MQWYRRSGVFLPFLCTFVYALPAYDQEKGWLDRCDLKKLQREHPELSTVKSTTKGYRPSGNSTAREDVINWVGPTKHYPLRPLAPSEDLLEIVKDKLKVEWHKRGGHLDVDDWSKDARGFDSEFDDDYSRDDDDYWRSEPGYIDSKEYIDGYF